jgi:hypothetical protein
MNQSQAFSFLTASSGKKRKRNGEGSSEKKRKHKWESDKDDNEGESDEFDKALAYRRTVQVESNAHIEDAGDDIVMNLKDSRLGGSHGQSAYGANGQRPVHAQVKSCVVLYLNNNHSVSQNPERNMALSQHRAHASEGMTFTTDIQKIAGTHDNYHSRCYHIIPIR